MNVSKVIGWQQGETPTVRQGFKIEAIATGLSNPRNLLALANGDLLVVESDKSGAEPIERPKRKIMDWIEAKAHGGTGSGPSNRILLMRAGADGKLAAPTALIDNLNAPYGIALVGDQLYVADTDKILRYPYKMGDTRSARRRRLSTCPPARSTTTGRRASPRAPTARSSTSASARTATSSSAASPPS
jgi:glucose/arabinose dehydrogenase